MAMFNLGLGGVALLLQFVQLFLPTVVRLVLEILVLIILVPLTVSYFYRRKLAKQGGQHYDERDKAIHQTAIMFGLMSMFMVMFLATFLTFIALGPGSSVRIGTLLDIFMLGALSLYVAESLTIILKYGRADEGEQL
jgi:ACR3 family arsenite efflux pump ArsB